MARLISGQNIKSNKYLSFYHVNTNPLTNNIQIIYVFHFKEEKKNRMPRDRITIIDIRISIHMLKVYGLNKYLYI